ncbi:SgcJ/EcaC family oxidoreductase [Streptosporangium carneum]|uniref:Death domain-containing protein n=1 Tax=Streptosporangium carneum TaxID=47481 RepID=A0A9W6MF11_9ACTN|nr:SgcJ/EcaC family oxidoreductase [Streptosporangium carneum]GLK11383.1 hypothetical protein GCM10017600_47900 [Streptosporangium carneum]
MRAGETPPRISVVIPTYNRGEQLRRALEQLTLQRLPGDEFEVVVSDDGSSDTTRQVAESFADRLRIVYHFQEDRGFRAAGARNAGARLASAPILAFLDSGVLAGPDCLAHHLAAHATGERVAVVGHTHGYNPENPMPGLAEVIDRLPPEEVYARFHDRPAFLDLRVALLAEHDGDLNRRAVPWQFFWTGNCSIRADDFWAVGGFDEDFHGWGGEDLELGFRIVRHGLPFRVVPGAWVVNMPHDRDLAANWAHFTRNMGLFLDRHREPVVELGAVLIAGWRFWDWDEEYRALEAWRHRARDTDVSDEVAEALRRTGRDDGDGVVVVGAGGRLPASLPPSAVVLDFDRELLDRALAGGRHTGHHAIGLRTPLADRSADTVIITSRLAGLWEGWGGELLAEARRVGREVHMSRQLRSRQLRQERVSRMPAEVSPWGRSSEILAVAGLDEDVSYYRQFTAEDEKAVLTVPMRIQAAWASNDPDAFANAFAERGSLLMRDTQLTSREEIRAYMSAGFDGPLRGARVKGWPLSVDFLSEDVAMAVTEGGIIRRGETEIAPENRIRATWVVVRQPDGEVLLLSHHSSPIG